MNSIPPDIYERVQELALGITNALEAGDEALVDSLGETLRAYYEEQVAAGRSHPFLLESVADFAQDPAEAARLYELALQQSDAFPDEPKHTKMICLAEKLGELGDYKRAKACLRDGRLEAVRCADGFWIEEADRLLKELGKR